MPKLIVYHDYYGCESGCCGHSVEVTEGELKTKQGQNWRGFTFAHPHGDTEEELIQFAKDLIAEDYGEEHVKDLDWANCKVVMDC